MFDKVLRFINTDYCNSVTFASSSKNSYSYSVYKIKLVCVVFVSATGQAWPKVSSAWIVNNHVILQSMVSGILVFRPFCFCSFGFNIYC